MGIAQRYQKIREEIPDEVTIVLAGKARTREEIEEVIESGAAEIGENYVQEAERMHSSLGERAGEIRWHMIGPLQKNKINKALQIFDVIQTVGSRQQAIDINERAGRAGRIMPVYIEINIGAEFAKAGVEPEYEVIENLSREISGLESLRLEGLMTMGPRSGNPEDLRPCFRRTRDIF